MITIIIGTNRKDNFSQKIAKAYLGLLTDLDQDAQILHLNQLPASILDESVYSNKPQELLDIHAKYISPADKFVFVVPEYQGGFPGILKLFLDTSPGPFFRKKKAGLIGLSSGRAGNLRGTDQLTNVLNYLKVNVHFSKPKISGVESLFSGDELIDGDTINLLKDHAKAIAQF